MGLVLLSDASNGTLRAVLDAGAVTALRTGAAAVLAAETLGRPDAETAAVVGAGVNGVAAAQDIPRAGPRASRCTTSTPSGRSRRPTRSAPRSATRDEALAADLLVTMTPGHEVLLDEGSLQPGQHVSLMGADGPGKAEIAVGELCARGSSPTTGSRRATTASSSTPSRRASCERERGDQLGDVLAGDGRWATRDEEITTFDSTGLAIQDLAIALAAIERAGDLDLATIEL